MSSCPHSLDEVGVLNKNDVRVFITNNGESAESFVMSVDLPESWPQDIDFIRSPVTVEAGETKQVDPIWITVPDVAPGKYEVKVSAEAGGEKVAKAIMIDVLRCRAVELDIAGSSRDVCTEKPEKTEFRAEVKNNGRERDAFLLGSSAKWASFSTNRVELDPGEAETVTITVDPPAGLTGTQEISITTQSEKSPTKDTKTISIGYSECYDFTAILTPAESTACIGKSAAYSLVIKNTGTKRDTYIIDAPEIVSLDDKEITVEPGEETNVALAISPEKAGMLAFDVSVLSQGEAGLEKPVSGTLDGTECRNVAVVLTQPEKATFCSGDEARIPVIIKNQGSVEETFMLTASEGELEEDTVSLQPKQAKTVMLTYVAAGDPGKRSIEVEATAGDISDRAAVELEVENCYSAEIAVSPAEQTVCAGSEAKYNILVKNTGKFDDTYTLKFGDSVKEFDLKAGQARTLEFGVQAGEGQEELAASLVSGNVELATGAMLSVKPAEQCYSAAITAQSSNVNLDVGEASTFMISLKNTGESEDTFSISLRGPQWVFISPERLRLDPGEEGEIFVYVTPPEGVAEGRYEAEVRAESGNFLSSKTLKINIGEPFFSTGEPVADGSMENPLGSLTGALVGINQLPLKTLALVGIVAIIVIILIVRAMLYFRS
ncbi:MAG: hypothetical protein HY367_04680 [Candidatus Aenigmarchaeota archaeon]|nr:hypothetical protein [Candidatus Aenigmarchaeota archaeon]